MDRVWFGSRRGGAASDPRGGSPHWRLAATVLLTVCSTLALAPDGNPPTYARPSPGPSFDVME